MLKEKRKKIRFKDAKENEKIRRENMGKYFLDLSKLTFVSFVLGGVAPVFLNTGKDVKVEGVIAGFICVIFLAMTGNKIFKLQ